MDLLSSRQLRLFSTSVVGFSSGRNLRKAKKKPRDTRENTSGTPVKTLWSLPISYNRHDPKL